MSNTNHYHIFNYFKQIYPVLNEVSLKYIKEKQNLNKFVGCCMTSTVGDFVYEGKFRYKQIKPSSIKITESDPMIIFTLMHEITHAITPYYERKVGNEWIRMDHSDKFYKNFYEIVCQAYKMNFIKKQYTLKELKILDKL